MEENIFDLQTDILNLITKHNLQDRNYAFIYNEGKLMIVDLTQAAIDEKVKEELKSESSEEVNDLQETEEMIK